MSYVVILMSFQTIYSINYGSIQRYVQNLDLHTAHIRHNRFTLSNMLWSRQLLTNGNQLVTLGVKSLQILRRLLSETSNPKGKPGLKKHKTAVQ